MTDYIVEKNTVLGGEYSTQLFDPIGECAAVPKNRFAGNVRVAFGVCPCCKRRSAIRMRVMVEADRKCVEHREFQSGNLFLTLRTG